MEPVENRSVDTPILNIMELEIVPRCGLMEHGTTFRPKASTSGRVLATNGSGLQLKKLTPPLESANSMVKQRSNSEQNPNPRREMNRNFESNFEENEDNVLL